MSVLFRVFVSFGMVVFGASASFAQSGWFWQNPLPQGNHLRAVAVSDSQTATAVGDHGTIVRTSDGGATWTLQGSTSSVDLRGVSFVDSNTGNWPWVAAGPSRLLPPSLVRTTDGGATWTPQPSGRPFPERRIFRDANTGTAVGGTSQMGGSAVILRTVDGGATWTPQQFGCQGFQWRLLRGCQHRDHGRRRRDHHEHDRSAALPGGPKSAGTRIHSSGLLRGRNTCTVVGSSGTILGTTDFWWHTWTPQYSGTSLLSVASRSWMPNTGTAVGGFGTCADQRRGNHLAVLFHRDEQLSRGRLLRG